MKCSGSRASEVFHIYVGNDWRNARAHSNAKSLLMKRIIIRENSIIKANFKAMFNVKNVKSARRKRPIGEVLKPSQEPCLRARMQTG